jgi:hypothetical protein
MPVPEYRYDIFFVEGEGPDQKQIYLFNGPHSFRELDDVQSSFFKAQVEHLERVVGDESRVGR